MSGEGAADGVRPRLALVGGPDVGLRQQMVTQLGAEFEVHVFGSDPSAAEKLRAAGGTFHLYPLTRGMRPWRDAASLTALRRAFRDLRPDVVHAYDSKPAALARLAARLAGVPVVIGTLPGLGSLYADERLSTRLKRGLYEVAQRAASRVSDLTILQNEDDLGEMVRRRVIAASKARVVPGSGIDTQRFRPGRLDSTQAAALTASLGPGDGLLVMMVARVIRAKGVLDYAAAAEILKRDQPGRFRLVLVGGLDDADDAPLDAAELRRVSLAVSWVGARDDVADLLSVADVVVLPTYCREGIPRALMEAAACGVPLIATNLPGCRDVVVDQQTGLLVPPRDPESLAQAIERLGDPSLRARLGAGARARVLERFDIRIICGQLAGCYREAISADLKRPPASA